MALDWSVIGGYFALNLLIGLWYRKRATGSTGEFFVSGRRATWWLAGTSMVATTFAADTPLAVTGLVASYGIAGNWLWWSMLLSNMLTVFFFARLWRRAGVVTDMEFAELRYGGKPAAFLHGFRALHPGWPINCIVLGWVNLAMVKIVLMIFPDLAFPALGIAAPKLSALLVVFGIMLLTTRIETMQRSRALSRSRASPCAMTSGRRAEVRAPFLGQFATHAGQSLLFFGRQGLESAHDPKVLAELLDGMHAQVGRRHTWQTQGVADSQFDSIHTDHRFGFARAPASGLVVGTAEGLHRHHADVVLPGQGQHIPSSIGTSSAIPKGAAPNVMRVTSSLVRPRVRRASAPPGGAENPGAGGSTAPTAVAPDKTPAAWRNSRRDTGEEPED